MADTAQHHQVLQAVQQSCADSVGLNPTEILPGYDLRDDLGMSPVELGEVLTNLQQEHGVTVPKEHLKEIIDELTTVESLVSYVEDELEL